MKKCLKFLAVAGVMSMIMAGCGDKSNTSASVSVDTSTSTEVSTSVSTSTVVSDSTSVSGEPTDEPEVIPENAVRSEITNEWIDESIKNQRPLAIMVDNEKTALDHYGLNKYADVVYELMNSTENGRVTRLMCIVKDWKNIEQFGSIRSTRPTNVMVAAEWNAVLIHDGGPFYINDYLDKGYTPHLSGGFARFSNGKNWEFTEYLTGTTYHNADRGEDYQGITDRLAGAGISENYTEYYEGAHFEFNDKDVSFAGRPDAIKVSRIELPYPHNESTLVYNEKTKLYEYSEYGKEHVDPLDDNKVLAFKNLIVYSVDYFVYDENGYMIYNCVGSGDQGWYVTDGYAIPIHWAKPDESLQTDYFDLSKGGKIKLNTGKTYITMVPSDVWSDVVIK